VESATKFIEAHIGGQEVVVGLRRERVADYPQPALREAIMNALSHRDYGLEGATVDIAIYDDRIEIQSPGSLPGHITTENMRREHYSRNPRLMRALKALALVEEFGEGVDRIYREMEARLLEPPIFDASPTSVTVTLRNRALASVEDQVWLSLLGQYELSVEERHLLLIAKNEAGVTKRRFREMMPNVDLDAIFSSAIAKGLVRRIGERGGARYILTDEVRLRAGASGLEAQSRKRQILLDEVMRRGSVSTKEASDLLGEDMRAARELLNDLALSGAVEARGQTRARRYYRT
jgi:ATP-dependent DNA helicase RecG